MAQADHEELKLRPSKTPCSPSMGSWTPGSNSSPRSAPGFGAAVETSAEAGGD